MAKPAHPASKPEREESDWMVGTLRGLSRLPEDALAMTDEIPMPPRRTGPVLSKAELDALLRPDLSDLDKINSDDKPLGTTSSEVTPRPADDDLELFEPDTDAPAFDAANEARTLATRLTAALRRASEFPLSFSAGPVPTSDASTEEERVHLVFEDETGDPAAAMALPARFGAQVLDIVCGGSGATPSAGADLRSRLARRILRDALAPMAEALRPTLGRPVTLCRIETEARFAALVPNSTGLHRLGLRMDLLGQSGEVVVRVSPAPLPVSCPTAVPAAALPLPHHTQTAASPHTLRGLDTVLQVRLVRLTVPANKLAALKPGQVLLLGVPADQPVELISGTGDTKRVHAEGRMGRQGGRKAVKISRLRRG